MLEARWRIQSGMTELRRAERRGRKFLNPVETAIGGFSTMLKVLPRFLRNRAAREPKGGLGPFVTDVGVFGRAPQGGLRVTWFGHSASLVEVDGVRILVDPVWEERASPVQFAGPKRFFAPTLRLEEMPVVDAVVISHDHYDHLGKATVRRLAELMPDARWVTPLGVGAILQGFGVKDGRVTELDWTESTVVTAASGAEVRVTAVPARHFSGRSALGRFETLWAAFVLAGERHTVYYGADTGYWDGFRAIREAYGPFDLTMMEVGAFDPMWSSIHIGPDGGVKAFEELGGGVLMPIHWGLFNLALHGWREPIERVYALAEERGIKLFAPEPGLPTDLVSGAEVRCRWW